MRWTDLATWVGPTVNQSGAMAEVRGLVLHTAEGYYKGTISWQKNPDANVSSHFIVAGARDAQYGIVDGKLAQMVDTDITAWTQRAGNGHWLSLECSGFGSRGDKLSPGQLEAAAQLLARAHTVYGVPLRVAGNPTERGLGHHSMDREGIDPEWGHDDCPGPAIIAQKPAIVARAIEIIGGDDMTDIPLTWQQDQAFRVAALVAGADEISASAPTSGEPVLTWKRIAQESAPQFAALSATLERIEAAVAELAARPPVQAAPVDPAALKAAVLDPEVIAAYAKAAADLVHADLAD